MAYWQFRKLDPNDTSGTSTAEDNFAQEETASADILVRECIQNALDARLETEGVVIRFEWKQVPRKSRFVTDLLTPDYFAQLSNGRITNPVESKAEIPFLLVEDFGTRGLCGEYRNSAREGEDQNWNAFWFREGEGAKPTKANGGAGQGKLTMYLASQLRTVVALTRRETDKERLLFGSCRFRRNYVVGDERYAREARWGKTTPESGVLSQPIRDERDLDIYESELGTARSALLGTSFLIPAPDDSICPESVAGAVVNEFYLPILLGRLTVVVGDQTFSSVTITQQAERLAKKIKLRASMQFRTFLKEIVDNQLLSGASIRVDAKTASDTKINPDALDAGAMLASRTDYAQGKIVAAEVSIRVSSVANGLETGTLRVFLQDASDMIDSQEIFVRQDLAVDKEKPLRGSKRMSPAMALVLIDDESLSRFLAAAEEPTHREWNGARPKLVQQYRNTAVTLRTVRYAASRLLELFSPAASRDSVALGAFFPDNVAHDDITKARRPKQKLAKEGADGGGAELPLPIPKKLELLPLDDGAIVKVNPATVNQCNFPLECKLQLAYSVEVGDAMEDWDAADFFLTDTYKHQDGEAVSHIKLEGNLATFEINGPNSWFALRGFDTNRRLDMRLRFSEVGHASDQ